MNDKGIKWTIYFLWLKTKKACKDKTIQESHTNLMKSCFAGWNPSELGWNLRCAISDEIKSASINPALAGFHRVAISSTKWIYSDAGGFNWKRLRIVSNPESFSGGDTYFDTICVHPIKSAYTLSIMRTVKRTDKSRFV